MTDHQSSHVTQVFILLTVGSGDVMDRVLRKRDSGNVELLEYTSGEHILVHTGSPFSHNPGIIIFLLIVVYIILSFIDNPFNKRQRQLLYLR